MPATNIPAKLEIDDIVTVKRGAITYRRATITKVDENGRLTGRYLKKLPRSRWTAMNVTFKPNEVIDYHGAYLNKDLFSIPLSALQKGSS